MEGLGWLARKFRHRSCVADFDHSGASSTIKLVLLDPNPDNIPAVYIFDSLNKESTWQAIAGEISDQELLAAGDDLSKRDHISPEEGTLLRRFNVLLELRSLAPEPADEPEMAMA